MYGLTYSLYQPLSTPSVFRKYICICQSTSTPESMHYLQTYPGDISPISGTEFIDWDLMLIHLHFLLQIIKIFLLLLLFLSLFSSSWSSLSGGLVCPILSGLDGITVTVSTRFLLQHTWKQIFNIECIKDISQLLLINQGLKYPSGAWRTSAGKLNCQFWNSLRRRQKCNWNTIVAIHEAIFSPATAA